jgi:hypothetical protein
VYFIKNKTSLFHFVQHLPLKKGELFRFKPSVSLRSTPPLTGRLLFFKNFARERGFVDFVIKKAPEG